jgi:ubiquinone/menaquinone biosynthesis C-methylase UbiE
MASESFGNPLGMAAQLGGNVLRFGWFYGISLLFEREAHRMGVRTRYRPTRPVPSRQDLLADLARLLIADAAAVRDGLYPPLVEEAGALPEHLSRLRAMFADLPSTIERREAENATSARAEPGAGVLPDYFTQDFHFQTGGYLSEESARLYDVQVETLFYGSANAMRRAALRPIAEYMAGRDQRRVSLLDVACGTGRFLRQVRLVWPAIGLAGLDLSRAYLAEAGRHMSGVRPATLIAANAEDIPFAEASQDIVTTIFLFHELPAEVRRRVATEMARVLKPGGLLVFLDSLQMGDRPGWDGLLEAFPVRFHEPYFRHYAIDDLEALLRDAGLEPVATTTHFLSKLIVCRRKG